MQFTIRKATPDDAQQLLDHVQSLCEEENLPIALTRGEFTMTLEQEEDFLRRFAESDNSVFLVACSAGRIIGSLGCQGGNRLATRHSASLSVSVNRNHRGLGVGSALIQGAIDWARTTGVITRLELNVYLRNEAAIRLYQRFGFVVEGRRRHAYYQNGRYEDDLIMSLLV